ncbi:hypothetical protein PBN151_5128 [Paenibacillus sp. NAIST15-1]|nr:hypothetical protein PBN151_5128 [Paenibacillus sp. NAIST15-1]
MILLSGVKKRDGEKRNKIEKFENDYKNRVISITRIAVLVRICNGSVSLFRDSCAGRARGMDNRRILKRGIRDKTPPAGW